MAKKASIAHRLYSGEISYDFIKNQKIWFTFTGVVLTICVLAVGFIGLRWGIEFSGGNEIRAEVTVTDNTVEEYRQVVSDLDIPEMDDLTVTSTPTEVQVRTRDLTPDELAKVKETLATKAGIPADQIDTKINYRAVSGSWGQQITEKGIIALIVFLVLVSVLITVYFRDYKMAIAAILALMHDLLVTVGVYALVGFSVTPATLIGILTILGYSLYDTVVVFDKIRENTVDLFNSRQTFSSLANKAVNQVLVRSINTTIMGVLPVAALTVAGTFILGTGPLKDLGLALLVGMIAGTYSSIFIATPLLSLMREVEPAMKAHREKLERWAQKQVWKSGEKAEIAPAVSTTVATAATATTLVDAPVAAELSLVDVEKLRKARNQRTHQSRSQRKS